MSPSVGITYCDVIAPLTLAYLLTYTGFVAVQRRLLAAYAVHNRLIEMSEKQKWPCRQDGIVNVVVPYTFQTFASSTRTALLAFFVSVSNDV